MLGPGARTRGLPRGHRAAGAAVAADRATRAVGPRGAARVPLRRLGGAGARRPGAGRARPAPADPPSGRPPGRLRLPLGLRRRPARPGGTVVVDAGPPTPTCSPRPGTARSASPRPDRPTWSARTAGTTPAARCAAARWPARCPRPVPAACGSAATWAGTGSRRTCWCSRTASTTGRCPGTARTSSPPTSGARWRCPGCGAGPVCPRRGRPPSSMPARSSASSASTTCRSPTIRALTGPGAEIERWTVTMAGPDGRRRRHGGEPAVRRGRAPHLPGDPSRPLPHLARADARGLPRPPPRADRRYASAAPRAASSGIASSVAVSEPW